MKLLSPQREAYFVPSLPACVSPARGSLTPRCDILQRRLRGPPGLDATAERCEAGGEKSSNGREKVGQGAGWLPMVWKLKWGRIRIPRGVQLDVNVDCGCERVDIVDVDVKAFPFCPPPVTQSSSG